MSEKITSCALPPVMRQLPTSCSLRSELLAAVAFLLGDNAQGVESGVQGTESR